MNEVKGLTSGYTISDIENFCRQNWNYLHERQEKVVTDYSNGLKEAFRQLIDTYFGGL